MSSDNSIKKPVAEELVHFPEKYCDDNGNTYPDMQKFTIVRKIFDSARTDRENRYLTTASIASFLTFVGTIAASIYFSSAHK